MLKHQDHEEPKVQIEYSPGTVEEGKPVHKGRLGIKTKLFAVPMHPDVYERFKKLAISRKLHAPELARRLINTELWDCKQRVAVTLPPSGYKKLEGLANEQKLKVSELVRRWIDNEIGK